MKVKIIYLLIVLSIFTMIFFISSESYAIPAFARQYKISCTTCHLPMPKLKPYGDEFAGNGFILKENLNNRDFIDAGDDLLFLNRYFPLAVRFDAFALYQDNKPVNNDLQTPWGLKLLSGGPLYRNIGYYLYFYFSESGEIAGIEDAYIHFDNIFKSNLDVMVGQFQICDPLAKRELRLTYEDYPIMTTRVGKSHVNLTYDRGLMLAYGIDKTKTDLIAMVVNGTGKEEAEGTYDTDNYKNVAFQLTQNVGDMLSIGGFVYYANAKDELAIKNEVSYVGPNINTAFGPLELTAAYMLREDSNPEFTATAPNKKTVTEGGFVEVMYSPQLDRSRFFLTGLYNWVHSDLAVFEVIKKDETKMSSTYHTATLLGTYWLIRNLRLNIEYTRDLENNLNRVVLGLISGF
jgi:hypothetical protein